MADAFQPKFADLVRNTTTTVGTGDFTLGAAMTGFTSFTAACQVGDSFYYSAIGIDKPAEREVGRGTLLAGGVISRDPIGGVKTNFSNGTKAVALITSAEWFSDMQSGAAAGPPLVTTRTALAAAMPQRVAVLNEEGREGLFVFKAGNLSALVAADAAQGIYVAPAGDPSGASGAWLRKYDGPVSVKWFGATGDGTTDDSGAFTAAIAFLNAVAVNSLILEYKASPRLFVPAGHYYLRTTTLDIAHTLIIEGEGGMGIGSGGGAATKLRWDANTTGIRIQSQSTEGATTFDASPHYSGAFSTLRQLYLCGPAANLSGLLSAGGLAEGECHGIHVKATVFLDNVAVEGFQGDGLYAHTTSGAQDATEGYSNVSRAYNCVFKGCRNGVSLFGGDANVWTFTGCQALYNRACGVDEQSFLGNTHMGWHTNGNGVTGDNLGTPGFPAYIVTNGGNRYCPVQGQEAAASVTAPGGAADTSVWLYLGAGGTAAGVPAWTSGISLRCAAPYRTNNHNGRNEFYNPYEEGNQGFSQFVYPTVIHGGLHGPGAPKGTGLYIRNSFGAFEVDNLSIANNVNAIGAQWDIGPSGNLAATDTAVNTHTTNNRITYSFKSWTAGVARTEYSLTVDKNNGVSHDARVGHYVQVADATIYVVDASGIALQSGKVLKVGATQVVGARQTGTAPDATDLASAIALVNDLKAKLAAHGLIA